MWLIKVLEENTTIEGIEEQLEEEVESMWLEAMKRRSQAVVAAVGDKEMSFWKAMEWEAIEIPEP